MTTSMQSPVLWCVLQVTIVALVTGLLASGLRRWWNISASGVLLSGAVLNGGLALLIFLPWPSWSIPALSSRMATVVDQMVDIESNPVLAIAPEPDAPVRQLAPDQSSTSWFKAHNLQLAVYLAIVGFVLLGVVRLIAGLLGVDAQRRQARPIVDPSVAGRVEHLSRSMGVLRSLEVRESAELRTAVVVGWLRPAILLPLEWREWSRGELNVVLAHELAHVARSHVATWILAQASLALNFYHPLNHWLVWRLKLEQEFEADLLAAAHSRSGEYYLEVLAQLALTGSRAPVRWPVRAFLPNDSALIRRITMLQDRKLATPAGRQPQSDGVGASNCFPISDSNRCTMSFERASLGTARAISKC